MDESTFWEVLDEILTFGEFVVAVPNSAASANLVGKVGIGRDGGEIVIDKDPCHCHVHLEPKKIVRFAFTEFDVGFGPEPCCELKTPQDETVLRLYLRGSADSARGAFSRFSHKDAEFVSGSW